MSKCFLFEVPKSFSVQQIQKLKENIRKQAFIELPTYADETHFEFLFDGENLSEEKLRRTFKLSAEIKIIDSSNYCH